jgi:ribosomal protein L7/L12
MQKFKLDCDACGAPLQNVDRQDVFKCPYCGRSYLFKEDFQAGSKPVENHPMKAKTFHPPEVQEDQRKYSSREELIDKIRELSASGNKIQAIKLYRDQSGGSLLEAKDFVERLMAKMG